MSLLSIWQESKERSLRLTPLLVLFLSGIALTSQGCGLLAFDSQRDEDDLETEGEDSSEDDSPSGPKRNFLGSQTDLTPCRNLSYQAHFVTAAAASPFYLAVSARGASVLSQTDFRISRTFAGHVGQILHGAISPRGDWAATWGEDGKVRIWDTSDGIERLALELGLRERFPQPEISPTPLLAIPPQGPEFLAFFDLQGVLTWIDPRTGELLWSLHVELDTHRSLLFSPDGKSLWLKGSTRLIQIDTTQGVIRNDWALPSSHSAALSPDGSLLATPLQDEPAILLIDTATGEERSRLTTPQKAHRLLFSSNAKHLVVEGSPYTYILDWTSGRVLLSFPFNASSLALSRDGTTLASLSFSRQLMFHQLSDGRELNRLGAIGNAETLLFTPEGRLLTWARHDGAVQLWAPETGLLQQSFLSHDFDAPHNGSLLDRRGRFVVLSNDTASYWNLEDAQLDHTLSFASPNARPRLSTHDGKYFIDVTTPSRGPGQLRFWSATNGRLARTIENFPGTTGQLLLSPTDDLLAVTTYEESDEVIPSASVELWDLETGTRRLTLQGHQGGVAGWSFSPNGQILALSSSSSVVRLWSVNRAEPLRDLFTSPSHPLENVGRSYAGPLAFSPDGKTLAVSSTDWDLVPGTGSGVITLISLEEDDAVRGRFISPGYSLNNASTQWSPDGQFFAASHRNGPILWCLNELGETSKEKQK